MMKIKESNTMTYTPIKYAEDAEEDEMQECCECGTLCYPEDLNNYMCSDCYEEWDTKGMNNAKTIY